MATDPNQTTPDPTPNVTHYRCSGCGFEAIWLDESSAPTLCAGCRAVKLIEDAWGRRRLEKKAIPISVRLYEELKDYLSMETDMTACQLLRRLRESNIDA